MKPKYNDSEQKRQKRQKGEKEARKKKEKRKQQINANYSEVTSVL